MTRDEAIALVQRIMDMDYDSDSELNSWEEALDRALGCPSGYVGGLIFWPAGAEPSAADVVDQALAYRPIAF